jgi:hypothetical protein
VIVIAHTHGEGTLVHGTARGDGTNLVIKSVRGGWRFSRNLGADGAWYLPHSQDRNADRARIERLAAALHDAGHPVEATSTTHRARPPPSRRTGLTGRPGGSPGTPSWPTPTTNTGKTVLRTCGNAAPRSRSASR